MATPDDVTMTRSGSNDVAMLSLTTGPSLLAPNKRAPLRPNERAWVAGTVLLITFLVFSSQLCIIIPHFLFELPMRRGAALRSLAGLLVPFNLGALGIYWNYANCVFVDPGGVPRGWKPPAAVLVASLASTAASTSSGDAEGDRPACAKTPPSSTSSHVRYCKSCRSFKPPRAHHCRTCKRCVLRMDHHCPWVANCVGQRNYASFMRFLACVNVTCTMHLLLLGARVADFWWLRVGGRWRAPGTWTMVFLILNFALCMPTLLLVGVFSIYHFWCLCTNTTTIEGWERDKVGRLVNRGRIRHVGYPFDLGILCNITSVLGTSPMRWCLPSVTPGDGLHFEVGKGIDDDEQYAWPPPDPGRQQRGRSGPDLQGDPFTYGKGQLNPALTGTLRKRRNVHQLPPWHPNFGRQDDDEFMYDEAGEEEEQQQQQSGSDDDGTERAADSSSAWTQSRVRRGSEGYEVRPKRYDVAYAAEEAAYDDEDDDESGGLGPNIADDDEKAWLWREQQRQEETMRRRIQAQWKEQLRNGQAHPAAAAAAVAPSGETNVMLPSEAMQHRTALQARETAKEVHERILYS